MENEVDSVLAKALELDEDARAELAEELLASLDESPVHLAAQPAAPETVAEAASEPEPASGLRIEPVDRSEMAMEPFKQVRRELDLSIHGSRHAARDGRAKRR